MFSYNVHYLLDFISEGKDCSMNKCFYSNLFYSLLTYGSTSDLILCTLSHHQPPELSQILRPPSLPTQTTTPCQTTSTFHQQKSIVLLKSFLATSAFQIVLRGWYLNCVAHLSVLFHFVFWCESPTTSVFCLFKKIIGGWVFELSWPTSAFFFILLDCCESLTTSAFRAI